MPKARVIQAAPAAPVFSEVGTLRWAGGSGNLGAPPAAILETVMPKPNAAATTEATGPALEAPPDTAVEDDAWSRTVAAREAAEGIKAVPQEVFRDTYRAGLAPGGVTLGSITYGNPTLAPTPPADLSALPARFTLEIERKPDGWWVVRAPAVHVGLFVAHQDLETALADAPGALAAIVRLDGVVPVAEKKKRRTRDA